MSERKVWPPEDAAKVAKLWTEGKSASQIGRIVGRSRNSIISKIHRLGLADAGRSNPAKPTAPRLTAPRAAHQSLRFGLGYQPSREEADAKRAAFREEGVAILADFKAKAEPAPDAIPLIGRPFSRCAFPVGTPATPREQLCCGADVREGASYCESHCAVAYSRQTRTPPLKGARVGSTASFMTRHERLDHYEAKRPRKQPVRTPWDEGRAA